MVVSVGHEHGVGKMSWGPNSYTKNRRQLVTVGRRQISCHIDEAPHCLPDAQWSALNYIHTTNKYGLGRLYFTPNQKKKKKEATNPRVGWDVGEV